MCVLYWYVFFSHRALRLVWSLLSLTSHYTNPARYAPCFDHVRVWEVPQHSSTQDCTNTVCTKARDANVCTGTHRQQWVSLILETFVCIQLCQQYLVSCISSFWLVYKRDRPVTPAARQPYLPHHLSEHFTPVFVHALCVQRVKRQIYGVTRVNRSCSFPDPPCPGSGEGFCLQNVVTCRLLQQLEGSGRCQIWRLARFRYTSLGQTPACGIHRYLSLTLAMELFIVPSIHTTVFESNKIYYLYTTFNKFRSYISIVRKVFSLHLYVIT
jgi:hypothetical protein